MSNTLDGGQKSIGHWSLLIGHFFNWLLVIPAVSLVVSLLPAGCTRPHRVEVDECGTPQYEQVEIRYEQPLSSAGDAAGRMGSPSSLRHVSATGEADAAPRGASTQRVRLTILYPHPRGRPDTAQARLEVVSEAPGRTPGDGPTLVLDFPRPQLDLLLYDLAGSGFFDGRAAAHATTELDVRIDGGRTAGAWTPHPRLEDFIDRVALQGTVAPR